MNLMDVALVIVGAFYAFAGFVGIRAAMMAVFLDKAIAALTLKPTPAREVWQNVWLVTAAAIIYVGGVALTVRAEVATWIFVVSAALQIVYVAVVAPRFFDADDDADADMTAAGRQQTINAMLIYVAATAFVCLAHAGGHLIPLGELTATSWAIAGALLALAAIYVVQKLRPVPPARSEAAADGADEPGDGNDLDDLPDWSTVTTLRVMADYGCHPLWAMNSRLTSIPPNEFSISPQLAVDFESWAVAYDRAFDLDDPSRMVWTDAERQAHETEGEDLARRLKSERSELTVFYDHPTRGRIAVE
jgi:hypothetical protein